ncbi:uncharacterized protein LOC113789700 [Dermatophagoides pteronyssinus]|uniref:uncharacterized protein LOC113789700 n=1 Tax=Dermatophagoides pteronyssinus TaxID=6956 RepID=UPI003F66AE06
MNHLFESHSTFNHYNENNNDNNNQIQLKMRKIMRLNGHTNVQRKSSRSIMIDNNENSFGILSFFRLYSKFMLGFSLFSLCLSIVLLFIGTYAYYEAHMMGTTSSSSSLPSTLTITTTSNINKTNESNINLQFYRSIMNFYGINETDLSMLYQIDTIIPMDDFNHFHHHQGRLHSYQISMLFVAVISILIEVGLICSIIFEHFKLSLFFNIIMIAGLFHHLSSSSSSSSSLSSSINASTTTTIMVQNNNSSTDDGITSSISFIYQILFLVLFLFYSFGIKAKNKLSKRLMIKNEFELNADQRFIQKA